MCSDPFFSLFLNGETFNDSDKEIIRNLSYRSNIPELNNRTSNFIRIVTNEFKNFEPADINLDTNTDAFATKQGYIFPLPTHATVSKGSGVFTLQFDETLNLDITKLFSIWVKYIENVADGTFRANPEMILNNELDYVCSIYYFVLGPDGKSIKYWSKYTGCYPTAIPYGSFGYDRGTRNITSVAVPFTYILKEDMNPQILEDFNRVALDQLSYESVSETSEFHSYKESNILSYDRLAHGEFSSLVKNNDRDPIVFFNPISETINGASDEFELSFGNTDIENKYYEDRYGDYDYDVFKSKI